jgi:hypothetical protein
MAEAAALDIPAGRVLRWAQLPAGLFRGGPVALAPEEYFRFCDAHGQNPGLAVAIGQAISTEMFSPPIFAALCSPNLQVAARRIATYKPLIGPMRTDITLDQAGLTVTYRWPAGMTPPPLLATTELVFWVAMARIATGTTCRPSSSPRPGCRRTRTQWLNTSACGSAKGPPGPSPSPPPTPPARS